MVSALPPAAVAAIRPLPAGYLALLDRVRSVAASDLRIRAVWLSGSVGRGAADAGSDLDVTLTVADDAYETFCASWREWLSAVTPTVLARPIPGLTGSWYSLTPGCERFDVVVERVHDLGGDRRSRIAVIDLDGLTARLAPADETTRGVGPDAGAMADIVEEFFRQQAIFPAAVVARADWLLGVVGVIATQQLLYRLFVEANQPLPPMGVKQWSARLTDGQRRLLESLPVPNPRPEEVVPAMLAVRRAMLETGRQTAQRCGVSWPEPLAEAVAAVYADVLGSDQSSSSPDRPDTRPESESPVASAANASDTTRSETSAG